MVAKYYNLCDHHNALQLIRSVIDLIITNIRKNERKITENRIYNLKAATNV